MSKFQELARDLWPEATVSGDGRFAAARRCGVDLHATKRQAQSDPTCECEVYELVLHE